MVFGHVIEGKEVVKEIESQNVDENSRPLAEVQISSCGELVLQVRPKGMLAVSESSLKHLLHLKCHFNCTRATGRAPGL